MNKLRKEMVDPNSEESGQKKYVTNVFTMKTNMVHPED